MSLNRCIAIDVMGGDFGPSVAVPAALTLAAQQSCPQLLLVGDEQQIVPYLQFASKQQLRSIEIRHTSDSLDNLIQPDKALRHHPDSSMYQALDLVRMGTAQACVSAGNTGALVLIARHLLKPIPGIQRPAMLACLPGVDEHSKCYLLDVGAHINCSALELAQFAIMGSVLASAQLQTRARVGLLNIGAEHHKGTEEIRAAAQLLATLPQLNYIGFVEANRIYAGDADVIVCDGFIGNVAIKTSAGVFSFLEDQVQRIVSGAPMNRVFGLLARPLLRRLKSTIDPARYNGASLLGLQGIVIKSHGNAGQAGFEAALHQASREISAGVADLIAARIATMLPD